MSQVAMNTAIERANARAQREQFDQLLDAHRAWRQSVETGHFTTVGQAWNAWLQLKVAESQVRESHERAESFLDTLKSKLQSDWVWCVRMIRKMRPARQTTSQEVCRLLAS